MLIGLDLDNTIVCYDQAFGEEAIARGLLAQGPALSKEQVRNALRQAKQEDQWTLLQGHIYGPGMQRAQFFNGVEEFFKNCSTSNYSLAIVSHRTLHPYLGEKHDLHQSARNWLTQRGIFKNYAAAITNERLFLECTKLEKLRRIEALGCQYFVDDLPEILEDPDFPHGAKRILFDPHSHHKSKPYQRVGSWQELWEVISSSTK